MPSSPNEVRLSYAPVVQRAAPAVVNVYAAKTVAVRNPLFDDPIFRRFFGMPGGQGQVAAGRADAALARLGRHRRRRGPRGHQQPRHRGGRPGQGLARRQARVRGRDRAQGSALGPRGAAHQGAERALPGARIRRFRCAAGRRPGARHRQSVRRRPDRDPRHRLGGRAHPDRHHRLPVLHPDRCRHQSRQFGRRAGRSRRQAGRHQHRDLLALGRLAGHRLRHSRQHGARWWWPRPRAAASTVKRPWLGRAAAGGDAGDRREPRAQAPGRRAGRERDAGEPGRRVPASRPAT